MLTSAGYPSRVFLTCSVFEVVPRAHHSAASGRNQRTEPQRHGGTEQFLLRRTRSYSLVLTELLARLRSAPNLRSAVKLQTLPRPQQKNLWAARRISELVVRHAAARQSETLKWFVQCRIENTGVNTYFRAVQRCGQANGGGGNRPQALVFGFVQTRRNRFGADDGPRFPGRSALRAHSRPEVGGNATLRVLESRRTLHLAWTYTDGSRTLLPSLQLELDVLAFLQTVKVELLEATAVEENLLPVSGPNEPKSAVADNPLDCPLHKDLDFRRGERLLGRSKTKAGQPAKKPLLSVHTL